jgi:uncharacterized protein
VASGELSRIATPAGDIPVRFDGPKNASVDLVLGPGAGAGMDHAFMAAVAEGIAGAGIGVWRFNFVYQEAGKKSPDRNPVLEETYTSVLDVARERGARKLLAGGKSMGGRIASQVAAQRTPIDGLVFHGYPLHPPGKPERIKDAHLRDVTVPMLFVEGTRDPFCPLETLEKVRVNLSAPTEVAVIDGGDHSFKVPRGSGRSTEEAWASVVQATVDWIHRQYPD